MTENILKSWSHKKLFDQVPLSIAVIDRDYNILEVNQEFKKKFSKLANKKCFQLYKNRQDKCPNCLADQTFADGKTRISEEQGFNKKGEPIYYIAQYAPLMNSSGEVQYIIEMLTDVSEVVSLKRQLKEEEEARIRPFSYPQNCHPARRPGHF